MKTPAAVDQIKKTLHKMASSLGEAAFDEWVLAKKTTTGWQLIEYDGARKAECLAEFKADIAALRETLNPAQCSVGDFAFSHEGHGTGFDAHMCVGAHLFLLLNNTTKNTSDITDSPQWRHAQVYFAELLEAFIADPLT